MPYARIPEKAPDMDAVEKKPLTLIDESDQPVIFPKYQMRHTAIEVFAEDKRTKDTTLGQGTRRLSAEKS